MIVLMALIYRIEDFLLLAIMSVFFFSSLFFFKRVKLNTKKMILSFFITFYIVLFLFLWIDFELLNNYIINGFLKLLNQSHYQGDTRGSAIIRIILRYIFPLIFIIVFLFFYIALKFINYLKKYQG